MTITINGSTGIASIDGSAGSPSTRGTDSNSGLFYGTNEVSVSADGVERVEVTAATTKANNKFVGSVNAASDVAFEYTNTNTTSGHGVKIKGGGTDSNRYILKLDNAAGTEMLRVTSEGRVGLYSSTVFNSSRAYVAPYATGSTERGVSIGGNASVFNSYPLLFVNTPDGGVAGSVTFTNNGTTVAYNTSSDYRLKENAVAISDGITRLKTLKPYRFNFKTVPSKTIDGFFAHEVTSAVPEAITGEKDGDEMQSIDQSKLVPLLTAALQEAVAKIDILETKVAALEAG